MSFGNEHFDKYVWLDLYVSVTGGAQGLGLTIAKGILEAKGDAVCLDVLVPDGSLEWGKISHRSTSSQISC